MEKYEVKIIFFYFIQGSMTYKNRGNENKKF